MRGCSSYGGCSCQSIRRLPDFHGYLPHSHFVGHAARWVIRPHLSHVPWVFPIGNTGPALAQIEEAKKVCARCEVRAECLAWALEAGQDHGVWGGMSEDERRAIKRRQSRSRVRRS